LNVNTWGPFLGWDSHQNSKSTAKSATIVSMAGPATPQKVLLQSLRGPDNARIPLQRCCPL